MLLKDQIVERPKNTKIFKRGNDKYVYHIESRYSKEGIRYKAEKRVCVGKMINENHMIPNDVFERYYHGEIIEKTEEAPVFSDCIDVGTYTLINEFISNTHIGDILDEIFPNKASLVKDLVSYILVKESCVFEYFPYWARKSVIYSDRIYSDSLISRFLKEEISPLQIQSFLSEWNKLNKDINDVYINVDSTNFNVSSDFDGLSDFGHAKDDKNKPQVNLSYLSRADNHRPLSYELYNGSVNDSGEINHLLSTFNKYGYTNIGFIFDRGYYSEGLVKKLNKEKRFFIMMLKDNYDYVKSVIRIHRDELLNPIDNYSDEYELSYVSKKVNISKSKTEKVFSYVHVYYSLKKAADDKADFLNMINTWANEIKNIYETDKTAKEKSFMKYSDYFDFSYSPDGSLLSYKKNKKAIREKADSFGYFAILTSKDISSLEVISTYRSRDSIEKLFEALKSSFSFDHPGVHYKSSLESKTFITFLAVIIRNEIAVKLRSLPLTERKQYTVPYVFNELNTIEASKSVNGTYTRRYALTARQKKILGLYKLKEKDIEASISLLNGKLKNKTKPNNNS